MAKRAIIERPPADSTTIRGRDIGHLLKQLSTSFRRQLDERLRRREVELSMAHMAALFTLQDEPGLAGAQLARRTMISAQAMSGVLSRLEQEQLIVRHRHPENRRTDCWHLTPAGRKRLTQARRVGDPMLEKMLATLSAAERSELHRLLSNCIAALQLPDAPARPHREHRQRA